MTVVSILGLCYGCCGEEVLLFIVSRLSLQRVGTKGVGLDLILSCLLCCPVCYYDADTTERLVLSLACQSSVSCRC